MLVAIIASVVTLIVVAIVVVMLFKWNNDRKGTHAQASKKKITNISSVGVSSSYLKEKKRGGSPHGDTVSDSGMGTIKSTRSRFWVMGIFAAGVFSALAAKVGSMQLFNSSDYEKEAQENLYRSVSTPAPRGLIFDAEGTPLVQNRTSLVVLADADVIQNRDVVQRLSVVLGIPHNIIRQRILDASGGAQSQRVVAADVSLRNVAFISEHSDAFPGITTQTRTTRQYPWGALAAHVLGYTGAISEEDLANPLEGVDHQLGDIVGQGGVEGAYENVLAGTHGKRVVKADAEGGLREVVSETDPEKGNDLYLTIKAPVQKVADKALAALVAPENGVIGSGKGTAASLVCMDVRDGSIVALASYPTYTPESLIGDTISDDLWASLTSDESHYPLLNRAISGRYPAASTFKAFTGLAGLEYGFASSKAEDPKGSWTCSGTWTGFGSEYPQDCWDTYGHGTLGFRSGVVVSCDVVFYEIAKDFWEARNTIGETAFQDYIKKFGFAKKTGIDLSGELEGRIPTPEWKAEYFRDVPENRGWLPGDMSNMSIGQGDVLITPIQLAVGYGAVATGKLIKPHVLKEVKNSEGDTVLKPEAEEVGTLEIDEEHLNAMRDALHGVTSGDPAVSKAFAGIDAATKTGTAEVAGKQDYGCFACYAPYDDPRYVVACIVEEGVAGAVSACPVSAEVLGAALDYDAGVLDEKPEYIPGSSGKSVVPEPTASSTGSRQD